METQPTGLPRSARHHEETLPPGLRDLPPNPGMTESDYTKVAAALRAAAAVVAAHKGELNAADLRLRALIGIAEKEAKRAALETSARVRRGGSSEGDRQAG